MVSSSPALLRKAGALNLIEVLKPRGALARAHDFWFRGGYPERWLNAKDAFRAHWVERYIQTYLFGDVKRLFAGLDDVRFGRIRRMWSSGQVNER